MPAAAELAAPPPDDYLPIIRELLSYDVQCEACCPLVRTDQGGFGLERPPSPLYWSRQAEWPWAIQAAELTGTELCLDVGAGWSVLKYALARRCHKVWCIDTDLAGTAKAQKTTEKLGVQNVSHHLGDACDLPFEDDSFDRVFCISVLEHVLPPHVPVVEELIRVLKPGGRLLLSLDVNEGDHAGEPGNFFVGDQELTAVLTRLGIDRISYRQPFYRGVGRDHDHAFHVVLAYWDKPA